MRHAFIALLLILIIPSLLLAWTGKVVKVTDGDTITVLTPDKEQIKVRLYGIDAPERKQAYGSKATDYLRSKAALKTVEVEEVATDRYGRVVGVVSLKDCPKHTLNEEMLRSGYAWVYRKYCDRPRCSEWVELEKEARKQSLGLWMDSNAVPPWEWRRNK